MTWFFWGDDCGVGILIVFFIIVVSVTTFIDRVYMAIYCSDLAFGHLFRPLGFGRLSLNLPLTALQII